MGGRGASSESTIDNKIINSVVSKYKESIALGNTVQKLSGYSYWEDNVRTDINRKAFDLYKNKDFTENDEQRLYNKILRKLKKYES